MSDGVAGVGFVIGGVLVALGISVIPGTFGLVIGVIGGVALLGLGTYRYGLLANEHAGIIAGTAGFAIVIASANRWITGGVPQDWLLLWLSVLGGSLIVIGLLVWLALAQTVIFEKVYATLIGSALGLMGIVAVAVWSGTLLLIVQWVADTEGAVSGLVLSTIAVGLGTISVVALYLYGSGRSMAFLDIQLPELRDSGVILVGIGVLVGVNMLVSVILSENSLDSAQHDVISSVSTSPELLLVLLPLSILIVGPGEELLYRNIIQKSLYESFSKPAAILVASVIFSGVHYFSYVSGNSPFEVVVTLLIVFILSLVLGGVYAWTENIVIPAVIHGGFNAVVFFAVYARVTSLIVI
jgi:membrane protease YdiL (CAAX protease family)